MRKIIDIILCLVIMSFSLAACGDHADVVQTCIVSDTGYDSKEELEQAKQPDVLSSGDMVYASIHFIESRKGMEYTVHWYLDGSEIKSETKETQNDKQDIVIYELDADKVTKGTLKLEVMYKDHTLLSREIGIQ